MHLFDEFKALRRLWFVLLPVLFSIIILYRNLIILDPDFGWLLRMGQIILRDGIPQKDPFSYTMGNYHFIAHEWLSEVLIAILYPFFGKIVLAIATTAVMLMVVVISASTVPGYARRWMFVPVFLGYSLISDFANIRAQVFSWLFFVLLLRLIYSKLNFFTKTVFILLILLLWVNMHGSFALGVGVVIIYTIGDVIKRHKIGMQDFMMALSSIFVTFINPYGVAIWQESFTTMGDRYLRKYITEWQPAFLLANFLFWVLLAFSVFFISKYWKKYTFSELVIFILLCISAVSAMKQAPYFVLFSIPLLTRGLYYLSKDAGKVIYGRKRLNTLYRGLSAMVVLMYLPYLIYAFYFIGNFSEKVSYPMDAVVYLSNNYPAGRMFTLYHLGGYINWKLPGYKVFVNGMMPIWKNHSYKNESEYAFREYREILTGERSFKEAVVKYKIDTLLLPAKDREGKYESLKQQALESGMSLIYDKDNVNIYKR